MKASANKAKASDPIEDLIWSKVKGKKKEELM